jgi:hypothetical protein
MRESLSTALLTAMVNTHRKVAISMKDFGVITNHTAEARQSTPKVAFMRVTTKMERCMALESTSGSMAQCIRGNGVIIA